MATLSLSRPAGIPIMLSVFRRGEKKPDHSSLRLQIATVINTFFVVRGLDDSLLNTSTAIVMRKNFEAFVTQNVKRLPTPLICPWLPKASACCEPKRKPRKISRIDIKRDLSWRNYTSPDLTANLDLDPVIASTRFALAAFFAGSIFTAGSPNLFASRAHEAHTSILSRTRPLSSVVTRYGFRFVKLLQRRQVNSMVDLLAI
jgi:hypothetical protein